MTYREFLENKIDIAPQSGIEVDPAEISPALKDHQRVCVLWALRGGRRGVFARFGLGKTVMQAGMVPACCRSTSGGQTLDRDAAERPAGVSSADAVTPAGDWTSRLTAARWPRWRPAQAPIVLTNYERVRDGDIDPHHFHGGQPGRGGHAAQLRQQDLSRASCRSSRVYRYKLTNTADAQPQPLQRADPLRRVPGSDGHRARRRRGFFKRDSAPRRTT